MIGFLLHFIEQSVPDVSQSFESHVTSSSNLIWTPERDESENQFGEWKISDNNWRWQFQRVKNSNSSDNLHSAPFKLRCLLLIRSASTHTTIFAQHDYCDDDLSQRCRRHQKQNTITRKTYGSENDVGARASATLFSVTILEDAFFTYIPWLLLRLFHFNFRIKFAILFHSATFLLWRDKYLGILTERIEIMFVLT